MRAVATLRARMAFVPSLFYKSQIPPLLWDGIERRKTMAEAIMTKETMLLESIGKKLSKDNQSYIVGYAQAVLDMYPPKEKKKRKERK